MYTKPDRFREQYHFVSLTAQASFYIFGGSSFEFRSDYLLIVMCKKYIKYPSVTIMMKAMKMMLPADRLLIFHQCKIQLLSAQTELVDPALPVPNVPRGQKASYTNHMVLQHRVEVIHDGGLLLEKTKSRKRKRRSRRGNLEGNWGTCSKEDQAAHYYESLRWAIDNHL